MSNWAVVIGVDRYSAPHLNLKGAVRDALSMLGFLTSGDNPIVAPARVKLLLSPTEASPKPPPGFQPSEATRKNVVEAFRDIAGKPPGRLFVHFSGHGLLAPGIAGGEAILPTDYEPSDPVFSIRLDGIRDFLRASKFDEQFFFIDACRNTPIEGNFNIGQFPITPDPGQMRPRVQQFVFCATLRGVKANEDRTNINDERGVFTAPLVRGLSGEGAAKIFDEDAGLYRVTAGRLLRYVRDEVRREVLALGLATGADVPQEPRLLGEMGDTEPALAEIAPDRVADVELRFEVTPAEAAVKARVTVRADKDVTAGPPVNGDTVIALPPRDYRVSIASPDFVPEKPSWRAELYESRRMALALRDAGLEGPGPGAGGPPWLLYRASNPLSVVRLLDARGRVVAASGNGALERTDLEPGIYRAQWIGANGASVEHTIELDEGGHEERAFDPPAQPAPVVAGLRLRSAKGQGIRVLPGGRLRPMPPGGHAVEIAGVRVAIPVLRDRVTLAIDDGAAPVILFPRGGGAAETARLSRIEIAQRYYRGGLLDALLQFLEPDDPDPMAAMLECYALLQLEHRSPQGAAGRLERLRKRVDYLAANFPELPDTHLLRAEVAAESAREACAAALDRGLPLFDDGSRRLLARVRETDLGHGRRGELESTVAGRVAGTSWTTTRAGGV